MTHTDKHNYKWSLQLIDWIGLKADSVKSAQEKKCLHRRHVLKLCGWGVLCIVLFAELSLDDELMPILVKLSYKLSLRLKIRKDLLVLWNRDILISLIWKCSILNTHTILSIYFQPAFDHVPVKCVLSKEHLATLKCNNGQILKILAHIKGILCSDCSTMESVSPY